MKWLETLNDFFEAVGEICESLHCFSETYGDEDRIADIEDFIFNDLED